MYSIADKLYKKIIKKGYI